MYKDAGPLRQKILDLKSEMYDEAKIISEIKEDLNKAMHYFKGMEIELAELDEELRELNAANNAFLKDRKEVAIQNVMREFVTPETYDRIMEVYLARAEADRAARGL